MTATLVVSAEQRDRFWMAVAYGLEDTWIPCHDPDSTTPGPAWRLFVENDPGLRRIKALAAFYKYDGEVVHYEDGDGNLVVVRC